MENCEVKIGREDFSRVECQKIAWCTKSCFEERDLQTYGHASSKKYSTKIEGLSSLFCVEETVLWV